MKMALEPCKTLEDFEKMLNDLPKPLGVEANFGVIDANGGALIMKQIILSLLNMMLMILQLHQMDILSEQTFRFPVKTIKVMDIYGMKLHQRHFLKIKLKMEKLSFEFLINDVPRCLVHSFTNTDLTQNLYQK